MARRIQVRRLAILALVVGVVTMALVSAANAQVPCKVKNLESAEVFTDLQGAINDASSGDRLRIKGTCVGSFSIDKDLTLRGATTPVGTLDGDDAGRTLLVASGSTVRLRQLTITGGLTDHEPAAGILNGGTLLINRSTVTDNHVVGGGIGGGGIYNDAGATLTLNSSSTVSGNTAFAGAGIFNFGTITLNDSSSVSDNAAEDGGGIFNDNGLGAGTLTLNDSSSVSGNTANNSGGGILNVGPVLTMNDSSSVTGNRANYDDGGEPFAVGGGIANCGGGSLVGAIDGGNVNDNYLGSAGTTENNIDSCI